VIEPNELLKAFDPLPSREIQQKVDYFFMPYSAERNTLKHMKFDSPVHDVPSKQDLILAGHTYVCKIVKDTNIGPGYIEF
jgi:hypothetical protein